MNEMSHFYLNMSFWQLDARYKSTAHSTVFSQGTREIEIFAWAHRRIGHTWRVYFLDGDHDLLRAETQFQNFIKYHDKFMQFGFTLFIVQAKGF